MGRRLAGWASGRGRLIGAELRGAGKSVIHLGHMLLFAAILSSFFAFLVARRGRRLRYALMMWAALAGGALLLGLLMYPFS
ncbi:MAG: hypothetical protein JSV80_10345 [Acidobacteriota bacterium]|nr:MAG: hypothetical protein JSV80_10345 [Acidobacteriota bacterium]